LCWLATPYPRGYARIQSAVQEATCYSPLSPTASTYSKH